MKPVELFVFEWGVDPCGYELVEGIPAVAEDFENAEDYASYLATNPCSCLHIRRRGGANTAWHDLPRSLDIRRSLEITGLWQYFLETNTPQKKLDFIVRFGFLFSLCRRTEEINKIEEIRRGMVEAVKAINAGTLSHLNWGPWPEAYLCDLEWPYINGRGEVIVEDNLPRFRFRPENLGSAIHLQMVLDLDRRARIRCCPECGKYFEYGPGTGRRSTAIYCQDKCRIAAFYSRATRNVAK